MPHYDVEHRDVTAYVKEQIRFVSLLSVVLKVYLCLNAYSTEK